MHFPNNNPYSKRHTAIETHPPRNPLMNIFPKFRLFHSPAWGSFWQVLFCFAECLLVPISCFSIIPLFWLVGTLPIIFFSLLHFSRTVLLQLLAFGEWNYFFLNLFCSEKGIAVQRQMHFEHVSFPWVYEMHFKIYWTWVWHFGKFGPVMLHPRFQSWHTEN